MAQQNLSEEERAVLSGQLERLREEHRDLDAAIDALRDAGQGDLQLQRLKKRKLAVARPIDALEDALTPDTSREGRRRFGRDSAFSIPYDTIFRHLGRRGQGERGRGGGERRGCGGAGIAALRAQTRDSGRVGRRSAPRG